VSDHILGKLVKVENVMVSITGQVGAGKSQVLNVIKDALKATGARLIECTEHAIIVNYSPPVVEIQPKIRSCNRHNDCNKAEEEVMARFHIERYQISLSFHCHDDAVKIVLGAKCSPA
jgi:ABC-type branched-subunit amino acid transport system ATPase component